MITLSNLLANSAERIIGRIDENTESVMFKTKTTINLILNGCPDSYMARLIRRHAGKLGLIISDAEKSGCWFVDTEDTGSLAELTRNIRKRRPDGTRMIDIDDEDADIDAYLDPYRETIRLSSCAESVYDILTETYGNIGRYVGIVGRGHAVQGLASKLESDGWTVTVCTSKTKNITRAIEHCDVVVNAAPVGPEAYDFDVLGRSKRDIGIIDVAMTLDKIDPGSGEYPMNSIFNRVGPVTIARIVNRAVRYNVGLDW